MTKTNNMYAKEAIIEKLEAFSEKYNYIKTFDPPSEADNQFWQVPNKIHKILMNKPIVLLTKNFETIHLVFSDVEKTMDYPPAEGRRLYQDIKQWMYKGCVTEYPQVRCTVTITTYGQGEVGEGRHEMSLTYSAWIERKKLSSCDVSTED